jgi:release factor glutamine methyltransferase
LDSAVIPLTAAGCDTPRLDAEVLLAAAMGVSRAALLADSRRELTGPQAREFMGLVRRRREREPVAYITGSKGFRYIDLRVDRRVLIPRPETEFVVEAALSLPPGARVVDVGTGSGAIALALKNERSDLHVFATDVSGDALGVAAANASRLGLEVEFVLGDLTAGLDVDAVVSNPPYVASGDVLMPDVAAFEPALALYAGEDGLDVIRRLVLVDTPFLALEHGAGQADTVEALARTAGFTHVERIRDLAAIERVLVARRAPGGGAAPSGGAARGAATGGASGGGAAPSGGGAGRVDAPSGGGA